MGFMIIMEIQWAAKEEDYWSALPFLPVLFSFWGESPAPSPILFDCAQPRGGTRVWEKESDL
jgi:hypothetical protein